MIRVKQIVSALIPSRIQGSEPRTEESEQLREALGICKRILQAGEHDEATGHLLLREEQWGSLDEVISEALEMRTAQ